MTGGWLALWLDWGLMDRRCEALLWKIWHSSSDKWFPSHTREIQQTVISHWPLIWRPRIHFQERTDQRTFCPQSWHRLVACAAVGSINNGHASIRTKQGGHGRWKVERTRMARCVTYLGNLWHQDDGNKATFCWEVLPFIDTTYLSIIAYYIADGSGNAPCHRAKMVQEYWGTYRVQDLDLASEFSRSWSNRASVDRSMEGCC